MKPMLEYALFAKSHECVDRGLNIYGIHNEQKILTIPQKDGWTLLREKLYVSFFADEGNHTLLINHENSRWNHSVSLTIKPEDGESFLQVVEVDFGVLVRDYPAMNVYSMLLDGEPLGKAYLVSVSL